MRAKNGIQRICTEMSADKSIFKQRYKLVVFDVDGTLRVIGKHYVPNSTIEAIKRLKQSGSKIVLATGRSLSVIDKELLDLNFDYILCVNGSYIIDHNQKLICSDTISPETARMMGEYFIQHNYALSFRYICGNATICGADQFKDFTAAFLKTKVNRNVHKSKVDWYSASPVGGICRIDRDDVHTVIERFPEISFYETLQGEYFDFTKRSVNKGTAIEKLCKLINIDIQETIAFGDGYNDIPMLEMCGIGVAMGNAEEVVKLSADYVTDDIEKDGLAKALDLLM